MRSRLAGLTEAELFAALRRDHAKAPFEPVGICSGHAQLSAVIAGMAVACLVACALGVWPWPLPAAGGVA